MREPLTLEQAMRAHKPAPFTPDEWDRLHRASRGEWPPRDPLERIKRENERMADEIRRTHEWWAVVYGPRYGFPCPDTPFTGTLPPLTPEP